MFGLRDASCKITPVMIGMDFDFPSNDKLKSFEGGNLECNKELVGTYLKTNSYASWDFHKEDNVW